jgi:hypothetical protein
VDRRVMTPRDRCHYYFFFVGFQPSPDLDASAKPEAGYAGFEASLDDPHTFVSGFSGPGHQILNAAPDGLYKICHHCAFTVDVRYCVECGALLQRRGVELGCELCGLLLRYKFCARCGRPYLTDRRLNILPPRRVDPASELLLRLQRPKKGVRGFVYGDLQEWFYMYDEPANRWKTCWALLAEQFLVLFCRLQFPQPSRIVPLQCRKLAMYEYHNDHDEFMIEIDPSDDGLDDSCRLITTDARIGQRWFHRMRLNARCRAVEDYYAIGEPYFELHGLVRRSRCHKRLTHELFLVTSVEKRNFEPEQVQKIRMSIALFKLLRHPALIDIKDVFESASKFFVVIPQLPGISYLGLAGICSSRCDREVSLMRPLSVSSSSPLSTL